MSFPFKHMVPCSSAMLVKTFHSSFKFCNAGQRICYAIFLIVIWHISSQLTRQIYTLAPNFRPNTRPFPQIVSTYIEVD
jgi:hypothetical protein